MTTYGPFYPTVLVNESHGGAPWTIGGGGASASIIGEGVTDFLKVTGFNADVPGAVKRVRFVFNGLESARTHGWNTSNALLVEDGVIGGNDSYSENGVELSWDVSSVPDGVALAYYTSGSAVPAVVDSVALYVDCE